MRKILILSLLLLVGRAPRGGPVPHRHRGRRRQGRAGRRPARRHRHPHRQDRHPRGRHRRRRRLPLRGRRPGHLLGHRRALGLPAPKRQDNVDVEHRQRGRRSPSPSAWAASPRRWTSIGESPVVDVASSSTDNTLSQDMLFNLPIRPDNAATGLLNYLPGVNNGSAFGGNEDYGNALLVDGVDTRDPSAGSAWTFFNFNLVEEVQVGGLGAPAEFGAYTGAVVNTRHQVGRQPLLRPLRRLLHEGRASSATTSSREFIDQNPTLVDPAVTDEEARHHRPARRPDHQGQAVLLRRRPALRGERQPERRPRERRRRSARASTPS